MLCFTSLWLVKKSFTMISVSFPTSDQINKFKKHSVEVKKGNERQKGERKVKQV